MLKTRPDHQRASRTAKLNFFLIAALTVLLGACVESASNNGDKNGSGSPPENPAPESPPTLTFSAAASSVAYGAQTSLIWSSINADQCEGSGAWSGVVATSGTHQTEDLTADRAYTLTCTGTGGTVVASVTVSVAAPPATPLTPVVTFSAEPASVSYLANAVLTWSSTNATSCSASGAWSGSKPTSGSATLTALTATASYTLNCSGDGGDSSTVLTIMVQAPLAPVLTFDASPATVAYNASSTLTWSAANIVSCTASDAWSGSKTSSGSQTLGALTSTATYTLTCSGAGGSIAKSVTVTVGAPPAPTVTLSANPASVAYNGSTTVTWSSTAAISCTGSGAWSGAKAVSGSATLTALTSTATYTLSCSGAGGSVSQSVVITVISGTAGTLTGIVDSSRINRNGVNKVYLYSGTVAPDDYDGDSGDPVASVIVSQDNNACTFSYTFNNVAPGTYTVAFTNQADNDIAGQNDTITLIGGTTVTAGTGATVRNFGAARVLQVGAGKTYATPSAAYVAAQAGDVVEIDAAVYLDDVVVWRQNNLTLRGVGGRAHLKSTRMIPYDGSDTGNGMAIWVTRGANIVIENIEFSGATVPDENGAGIRAEGNGLTICGAYFHDNEDGILGGSGVVLIEYSEFNHNGINGDGYTHNLYIDGAVTKFIFRHNYSHRAHIGHELKSRALENHILYNRLMNEEGDASYTIDIPNGGLTYVIGNIIQQGLNTDNSTMVNYGAEGLLSGRTHKLFLINNTLVNDRASGTFIAAAGGTTQVQVTNNLFVGSGTDVSGPSSAIARASNLVSSNPGLVNRAAYNYRLLNTSPAINQGTDPGTAGLYNLQPQFQYADIAQRELRVLNGAVDIGAYEYLP